MPISKDLLEILVCPICKATVELKPDNSGLKCVQCHRVYPIRDDIPVMLITGKSDPKGAVRAYEAGADDVILKPFHFEVLFARIERRIDRARSVRRLQADNAALDARVVERAIQIGELREQLRDVRRGSHAL